MKSAESSDIGGKAAGGEVDLEVVRVKYRQERDKRVRPEGSDQFIEARGQFSHYLDDPGVDPKFNRPALNDQVEVLIIGGGWGGMLAAVDLQQVGIRDICILDQGGDFGGTWYWNRYPGAQCDIESYIYLPLLEETGYVPQEKYSYANEIRDHARRIGEAYDLYSRAHFRTRVTELRWNEDDRRWMVKTDRGDEIAARFVVMSSGPLNRPKLPGIPGIGTFKGHTFHTSRWDYSYTGGDSTGNLQRLADKRVAVVGTGASAIQCVPHLGRDAKHLYVFQRTPSTVDARGNRPTDPEWVKTLKTGWHLERMQNFHSLLTGIPQEQDLVSDGWTDIMRYLGASVYQSHDEAGQMSPEMLQKAMELADYEKMEQIRSRVDELVQDKKTASALKPWYRYFCKRPGFSDTYLQTFNRPNVTLVDTVGRGVDRITENSLIFNGVEYEADCIIFATGFEVGTDYTRRAGMEVYGLNGKTLSEHWRDGYKTLHGFFSHGFPNLLHMGLTQNAGSFNFPYGLDMQAKYVAEVLQYARSIQARRIEPTAEAEAAWVKAIHEQAFDRQEFLRDCTPGYYNNEGDPVENKVFVGALYDFNEFLNIVGNWRADGRRGMKFDQ